MPLPYHVGLNHAKDNNENCNKDCKDDVIPKLAAVDGPKWGVTFQGIQTAVTY